MEKELLVGILAFAGVVITTLAGLLVRERRRNENHGHNPGGLPAGCPYVKADGKVDLSEATLTVLVAHLDGIRQEVAGVRSAQGKILDGMGDQNVTLGVIKERLGSKK